MSSYITCKLEIKSLGMLKQVLDNMGLSYEEGNLTARGYGRASRDVQLLVTKKELNKIDAGAYGDMGFQYNKTTETYDVVLDDVDKRLANKINQLYAVETIKNFATANRKSYTVVSGSVEANQEVILDVYI